MSVTIWANAFDVTWLRCRFEGGTLYAEPVRPVGMGVPVEVRYKVLDAAAGYWRGQASREKSRLRAAGYTNVTVREEDATS